MYYLFVPFCICFSTFREKFMDNICFYSIDKTTNKNIASNCSTLNTKRGGFNHTLKDAIILFIFENNKKKIQGKMIMKKTGGYHNHSIILRGHVSNLSRTCITISFIQLIFFAGNLYDCRKY